MKDAFVKNATSNGRWEILSHTTNPPHAIGAMSWALENDVDFLLGHLNNAFAAGAKAGLTVGALGDILGTKAEEVEIRLAALKVALHPDFQAEDIVQRAKVYETYLRGDASE